MLRTDRRSALKAAATAMLGGTLLASPAALAANMSGQVPELLVRAPDAAVGDAALIFLRSRMRQVEMAADPAIVWRKDVAPVLARGGVVAGISDPHSLFVLERLALLWQIYVDGLVYGIPMRGFR